MTSTILEALLAKFDGDDKKAFKALTMLIALMENHGKDYNCNSWDEDYRETYLTLLDALWEEHKG